MNYRPGLPVALAIVGFVTIVVGIHQGLLHIAPGYEGTIMTGWDGTLNHEEFLLAGVGAVAVGGTVATRRWQRLATVPVVAGAIVLFYVGRALLHYVRTTPLYTETTIYSGDTVVFILGAEPFLLVAGGLLLVSAGVLGWRQQPSRSDGIVRSLISTRIDSP
jgi:phosphoglycerol transferase MdoB-like AlkP superfamily enzyme